MPVSYRASLTIIFLLAAIVYGFAIVHIYHHPNFAMLLDSEQYLQQGYNILRFHTAYAGDLSAPIEKMLFSLRPPLYSLFTAGIGIATKNPAGVAFFQALITFACAILFSKISLMIFNSKPTALLLTAIYLFYPAQIVYSCLVMSETVFQGSLLLALYFFIRFIKFNHTLDLLWYNLVLTIGVFIKPVMIYFGILSLLIHFYLAIRRRSKIIAILPLIFFTATTFWCLRNQERTGLFHFSSMKTNNLLHHNARVALAPSLGNKNAILLLDSIENFAAKENDYAISDNIRGNAAKEIIFKHIVAYAIAHIRGMCVFFIDPGRYDIARILGMETDADDGLHLTRVPISKIPVLLIEYSPALAFALFFILIINTILTVSFLISIVQIKKLGSIFVFIAVIVLYLAFISGPVGTSRYRLAIQPYLLLSLPLLLHFFRDKIDRKVIKNC